MAVIETVNTDGDDDSAAAAVPAPAEETARVKDQRPLR
jgi:hypothetical protein